MNSFDKNLKRLRIRNHLKQEDLAKQLNVTRQTVSGWETGRRQPDLDMLKKLAEALEVDVQELIYGNKPGGYLKFQRTYVVYTTVSGGIAAAMLLFRLLVLPHVTVIGNTYHWGSLLTICFVLLPQIGTFAFGAFFPGLIRLFRPVVLNQRARLWCLSIGLTALVPALLFWLGFSLCSRWVLYPLGNAMLLYILPAVSGFLITTGILYGRVGKTDTQTEGK